MVHNKILLVGAAGNIGKLILKSLLENPSAPALRLYVRNPSKLPSLPEGVEVVKGDYLDVNAIEKALDGVDCVVCAYGYDPAIALEGQLLLARLMERKGIKNLLASAYNYDWSKMKYGDLETYDLFITLRDQLLYNTSIHAVYFSVPGFGIFDSFMQAPWNAKKNGTVDIWGTGEDIYQWTCEADVAAATAELALNPENFSSKASYYRIYGDEKSTNEAVKMYEEVKNVKLELVHRGTVEDLDKYAHSEREKHGKFASVKYSGLFYQLYAFTKYYHMDKCDNGMLKTVKWRSVKQFLEDNKELV